MLQILLKLMNVFFLFTFISCKNPTDVTEIGEIKLIANAGNDQTTLVGSYAVFDPTRSTGNFNWYDWQQDPNNPEKVNIWPVSKQPKTDWDIRKIVFTKEGIYRFILIVRVGVKPGNLEGTASSKADTLIITVNSSPYSKFDDPNLEAILRAKLNKQVEILDENTLLSLDTLMITEVIPLKHISSLKGLEYCKNLLFLGMGSQDISNISPLSTLIKLKYLWLDQNRKITDITPLAELINLENLNLNSNLITDISALEKLTKLTHLYLDSNPITDLYPLRNMKELKQLWLFQASINDLTSISEMYKLEHLWLTDCDIKDISQLNNLSTLKNLKLAWNQIEDITQLKNMVKLEWAALEKNSITDITSLKELQNLSYVRLWDNQIVDIKPLVDNPGINKGDIVGLDGNPLSEKSINEYIPELQARGVLVTW